MSIIYDPWNSESNILSLLNNNNIKNINVLGPINKNNDRIEIQMNLNLRKNSNELFISSILSSNTIFEIRIIINLKNKTAIINRIEKFIKNNIEIYSGSDIMKLSLKILKDIGIEEVSLEDQSTIECNKRLNNENFNKNFNRTIPILFTKTISYSLFSLFRYGSTFYMNFGFLAYLENEDKTYSIVQKFKQLENIKWETIEYIINRGNKTIQFINSYTFNESIFNRQKSGQFDKITWKKYWKIITNSYNSFYTRYKDRYDSPFKALKDFNYSDCKIFINWLELYSLSSRFFDITSYIFYKNNGTNEKIEIPLKNDILDIIILLKKIKWKIINLQQYNNIFTRLKRYNNKNILINIDKLLY